VLFIVILLVNTKLREEGIVYLIPYALIIHSYLDYDLNERTRSHFLSQKSLYLYL